MARTKEEIRNLVSQVMEHPNYDTLTLITDDHICGELEVNTKKLLNAIIDDDIDGVINAFTGWDAEGLLFTHECSPLHRFVREPNPPKEGAPAHKPPADGQWKAEDYTWEYCPECDTDQVIYSKGVTACPNCGAPLAPCSCCEDGCDYSTCPYGCTGGEEDSYKAVTNPPISEDERKWYAEQDATSPFCPVPDASDAETEEGFSFDNDEEESTCDCPHYGTPFGYECPYSGHGICSDPCGHCNGPASASDDNNSEDDEDEGFDSAFDSNAESLDREAWISVKQFVATTTCPIIFIKDNGNGAELIFGTPKEITSSPYADCFFEASGVKGNSIVLWLHHDEVERVFGIPLLPLFEDDEDGDFECCYDCSQCEINGNCERQEHMSEVDNEVDAL